MKVSPTARIKELEGRLHESEGYVKYLKELNEDVHKKWGELEITRTRLEAEKKTLELKIVDLEERLGWMQRRLEDAIDATFESARAAGSIARITNSLGQCIDTLEVKLDNDNRDRARKFRS